MNFCGNPPVFYRALHLFRHNCSRNGINRKNDLTDRKILFILCKENCINRSCGSEALERFQSYNKGMGCESPCEPAL